MEKKKKKNPIGKNLETKIKTLKLQIFIDPKKKP
jgi:hypothetical protein